MAEAPNGPQPDLIGVHQELPPAFQRIVNELTMNLKIAIRKEMEESCGAAHCCEHCQMATSSREQEAMTEGLDPNHIPSRRAHLKRKAPDSLGDDVIFCWGLKASILDLRSKCAMVDQGFLRVMACSKAEWWVPNEAQGLLDALVESQLLHPDEPQVTSGSVLDQYLQALLPHLASLPKRGQQQLQQLKSLQDFLVAPTHSDGPALQRLLDLLSSLPGWQLPMQTLVYLLEKICVRHFINCPLPQPRRQLLCRELQKVMEGSADMPEMLRSQLKVFEALFTNLDGFTCTSSRSVEHLKEHLQGNLQWLVSRAGGSIATSWLYKFLVPLNISLLTSGRRSNCRVVCARGDQAMKLLVSLHKDHEAGMALQEDIQAQYSAALRWILKECDSLHLEDPSFKTGTVRSKPWPMATSSTGLVKEENSARKMLECAHRMLKSPAQVDYGAVNWANRKCSKKKSDQLLFKNNLLHKLHEEIIGEYIGKKVEYRLLHCSVREVKRNKIIGQLDQYFMQDNDDPINPKGVELRRIGDDDPRESLRGQWGLFASMPFAEYHVLGPYAGELLSTEQYESRNITLAGKLERDRYSYDLQTTPAGYNLTIDPLEVGNQLTMINDRRLQPLRDNVEYQPANVRFLEIVRNGWPYVFVVTTKKIKPGTELVINYGDDYWDSVRRTTEPLTHVLQQQRALAEQLASCLEVSMSEGASPNGAESDPIDVESYMLLE